MGRHHRARSLASVTAARLDRVSASTSDDVLSAAISELQEETACLRLGIGHARLRLHGHGPAMRAASVREAVDPSIPRPRSPCMGSGTSVLSVSLTGAAADGSVRAAESWRRIPKRVAAWVRRRESDVQTDDRADPGQAGRKATSGASAALDPRHRETSRWPTDATHVGTKGRPTAERSELRADSSAGRSCADRFLGPTGAPGRHDRSLFVRAAPSLFGPPMHERTRDSGKVRAWLTVPTS